MVGLGVNLALACREASGTWSWWGGRVQQMLRKSQGKTGKYVQTTMSITFDEAQASKLKVVCSWHKKSARGYVFTYDGPIDTQQYSMEYMLGVLDLEMPDAHGKYRLRDSDQGRRLDAALKMTQPSLKPNSTRTRGEEVLAEEARRGRETSKPEDEGSSARRCRVRKASAWRGARGSGERCGAAEEIREFSFCV